MGGVAFWKMRGRDTRAPRVVRFTRLTSDGQAKSGPLATDGSRIYFTETMPDARILVAQVSVNGGDATPLPIPLRQPMLLDLSRDGTEFLLRSYEANNLSSFRLQPVAGGSPRRIGSLLGNSAAFGADGKSIIYSDAKGVYSVGRDGSDAHKLLTPEDRVFHFRFSPQAKVIRFSQNNAATDTTIITEVRADGTDLRKIADGCCGEWTPNGRFFVFQNRVDNRLNFWVLPEAAGRDARRGVGKITQLTAGPVDFRDPLPGRDGKQIFAIGGTLQAEVIRYDSRSHDFVPYLSGISADGLSFSPDGQWVTYTSYPDGTLWRSRVDGSERLQLTSPPVRAALPRWSPDAKQIAFSGNLPGAPWNIYIISSGGGTAQHLLPGHESQMDVNWSPDGNSLVYCHCGEGDPSLSVLDLRSRSVSTVPSSQGLYSPHWSPDGRYISGTNHETHRLMLYDLLTTKWTLAVDSEIGFPSWSRDGKYLYFEFYPSLDANSVSLGRLRLSDRNVEHVAELAKVGRLTTGTFGRWFGLAPDDSLLFARDISTQEIYALDTEWE